jgi:hypothetical protein
LRRIRDDEQIICRSEFFNLIVVGGQTEQVNGDDRARLETGLDCGRQCGRQTCGIEVERLCSHIPKHRCRAEQGDTFGRRGVGEIRADHGITWANALGQHDHGQRVRATRHGDRVPDARERRELAFQRGDLRPHDVLAMIQNPRHGTIDLRPDSRLLGRQIDEGQRSRISLDGG